MTKDFDQFVGAQSKLRPLALPHEPTTLPPAGGGVAPAESLAMPSGQFFGTVGRRLGDYELVTELGRGGMGVVFRAKQHRLDRIVAVKMLLPNAVASGSDLQRFRTEVEATAHLQHPHIVRVYEVGEADGRPFYSMDYIDGPSFAQRLQEGPLPGKVAARYLVPIAQAIQHAHDRGILHRDLKPSNILLDAADRPYVTDFGLAKRVASDSRQTHTGAILGTPSYMAPEQAAASKELTSAADVYGLGAVLYELVTGRPPFRAETPLDTLLQVIEREPAPPRLLNPKIDPDLETICLKCLDKVPHHRYATARALGADLERYLAGESISARSVNLLDRLARTVGHSSFGTEFHNWGNLLLCIGVVIFVCHTAAFIGSQAGLPLWFRWVTGGLQFVLIGVAFWRHRPGRFLPTTSSERQLWSIWIGYLLAFAIAAVIALQTADREVVARLLAGEGEAGEWFLYPYSAMLTGFAFFVMGSNYWGGCYVVGLGFFALATVMPLNSALAPLEFALLWSATLIVLGTRLRRLRLGGVARRG